MCPLHTPTLRAAWTGGRSPRAPTWLGSRTEDALSPGGCTARSETNTDVANCVSVAIEAVSEKRPSKSPGQKSRGTFGGHFLFT